MNYISTLFPYWEKHKIHFQTRQSLEFGWWEFVPKKETFYQRIDHISRILNVSKLCWYLISLLRKTQNTFLEPAVKFFGWWESFPKKETHHQNMDYISRTLNLFELHQYLISLLRKWAALSASDYQVIYYLIWIPLVDFIVICFGFDGIILQHVTLNLAQFKCLAHNYVIFWHQM